MHDGSSVESGFEPGALRPKAETLPLGRRGHTIITFLFSSYRFSMEFSTACNLLLIEC
ncbi:hypothetical protein AVEN_31080-1, partial [Araneus ventricosus]